jgi:hypothetical protein
MRVIPSLAALLTAAVATAAAPPDKPVDPSTIKDKVTIKLGQKLAVQFEQQGDALSRPRGVEKAADKPPTVTFDFRKQNDMLFLITRNPFAKDMKFRALARHEGRKDYLETSIVPVKAGLLSFELWQEPIEELVLFDFKLLDEKP